MSFYLALQILLGSVLLAAAGVYLVRRSVRRQLATTESTAETIGDAKSQLCHLIESNKELQSLYERLGYSAKLDREAHQIVAELKATIRTEVTDFPAFLQVLEDVRKQMHPQPDASASSFGVQYQPREGDLLTAVLSAGSDQTRILQILNRDPLHEQLPFVEQIPINKNGEVIWRTPLEHSLIRKRPTNPVLFAERLDQLESLFKEARTPQSRQIQREVVEAILRTRRDLQKETAYMPTSLQALERKVEEYILLSPSIASQTKIRQLDALLEELIELSDKISSGSVFAQPNITAFKQTAQQQAKTYLEAFWMHTPWLSTRLLATLLDLEVVALPKEAVAVPTSPAAVLKVVRDEVSLGSYDSDETIRRLQQQEDRGLFVNSLVYPLLRLNGASQVHVKKAMS